MTDNTNNYEELAPRELIKKMPGFPVHWACQRLLSSYSIMIHNGLELINFCQMPHEFKFQFLPNTESRLIKNDLDNEALRLIHNFVASVKTLVDISRNYSKKYLKDLFIGEYKKTINDKIKKSIAANFIFDLRNFILHREMPTIGNTIDPMTGISNRVYLHVPKLLEWKKWSSLAQNFILKQNEKDKRVLIDELANEYILLSEDITKILLRAIVNSNFSELENVYNEAAKITANAEKKGMITDPLIVQFFTKENGYIFPSVMLKD